MKVRIFHYAAVLGLCGLCAGLMPGCDRFFGKSASTAPSTTTKPAEPVALEVGGGKVQESSHGQGNVAVIFTTNRLGEKYKDQVLPLQDYVVAESNAAGYSCITLETAQESITPGELDRVTKSEASRLAMARSLGADYLIAVNITSYDEAVVVKNVYNVPMEQKICTLALTYQVADRNLGGSLDGGTVTVTKEIIKTPNVSTTSTPFNELLRRGATELAAKLKKNLPPPPPIGKVPFFVDVRVQGFKIPNIMRNDKGEYIVSSEKFNLLAEKATIVLDGGGIGTTPQRLCGPKGLHKMRFSRDGCRTWEENIAINEGAEYIIDLQLTDESIARWKDMTSLLAELKNNEKLTDGKVDVLKGFAQTLRQSGFKVDVKADINSKDMKIINMIGKCFWTSEK